MEYRVQIVANSLETADPDDVVWERQASAATLGATQDTAANICAHLPTAVGYRVLDDQNKVVSQCPVRPSWASRY